MTFHRTIGMKPIDVKSDSYAEYNKGSHEEDPKFIVGHHVRISKCKTFSLKDVLVIGLKKFLKSVKLKSHELMLLVILMVKKLL